MQAAARGLNNYAISAFCIHNTQLNLVLPGEFYESYRYVKRKWINSLPIQTTCVRMEKSDRRMYVRRIREAWLRISGRSSIGGSRAVDGAALLAEFDGASRSVVDLDYKNGGYASK